MSDATIHLDPAAPADAERLSNLLELYIHDLSAFYPHVEIGDDGRFGYPELRLYWSEPGRRFPFLIRRGDRVAGFVLAKRGSPVSDDPEVLDVVEFFVLRQYRRGGIGRAVALQLWQQLPGNWTVRVSEGNRTALEFWSGVIAGGDERRGDRVEPPRALSSVAGVCVLCGRGSLPGRSSRVFRLTQQERLPSPERRGARASRRAAFLQSDRG